MKCTNSQLSSRALLEIQDLRTHFEAEGGLVPAVDGVSLTIQQGRTVALVGESGCGKSVTALSVLRLIPQPPARIVGGRIIFNDTANHEATKRRSDEATKPRSDEATERRSDEATKPRSDEGHSTFDIRHSALVTSLAAPPTTDSATDPIDLLRIDDRAMRRIRGNRIAMIFQEPMTALNPVYSIGEQVVEAVELHQGRRGKEAWAAAVEALRRVGIPDAARRCRDYPHQLSGGMRQRAMIAMALSCQPALLIADEPTTALDVTVQRQILELLRTIQAESGMSILLITHDFGVVAEAADDVYVMYAGRIVEHGPAAEVLAQPLHPYTQGLMRCTPRLSQRKERLEVIPGSVPDPRRLPGGCRFHPRCPLSAERARAGGCEKGFSHQRDQPGFSHQRDQPGFSHQNLAGGCEKGFSHQRETVPVISEIADSVLRRCVEEYPSEPSGSPTLREVGSNHFVACWEAEAMT